MKLNWKTLKVILALVVVIGTILWAVDSVRTRSYAGTSLNFVVGQGVVTVTNASDQAVPVQLVGAGSRSFSVLSDVEGIAGSSVRDGTGSASTYLFNFALMPGINAFTVARGAKVNFVANTETRLDATVEPLDLGVTRATLILAVVVIVGSLFYVVQTTGLIRTLRGQPVPVINLKPVVESAVANQGQAAARSYGDNRADTSR